MRHQGHEVHLVTQDPRYLDVHLRRLCNGHVHYWRVFKSQQLIRFESEVVIEKVEVKSSFKDADKKTVRLDKKYFSTYTSTNAKHHFQAKLPTKFILAILVIIVAGVLTYRFYERYQQGKDGGAQSTQGAASNDSVVSPRKARPVMTVLLTRLRPALGRLLVHHLVTLIRLGKNRLNTTHNAVYLVSRAYLHQPLSTMNSLSR
ncbi:zonular occludens toxin domain-containing protein [Pseudomonas sp. S9]|uniref:zonular occludens toxin domain-containing protein n=1 Tax=Pseudomonas sp. S9 TaxID=686578 RepID=UPI0003190692|nr:zonular occludens toxin domain-containing protein [Pseudomonas sp. S9]